MTACSPIIIDFPVLQAKIYGIHNSFCAIGVAGISGTDNHRMLKIGTFVGCN